MLVGWDMGIGEAGFSFSHFYYKKKEELTISFDSVACPLAERSVCHRVAT